MTHLASEAALSSPDAERLDCPNGEDVEALAWALAARLHEDLVEATARRVVELLHGAPAAGRLVTTQELADRLGVSRATVYEHADELGAIRLGEVGAGRKPRLRFDLERALSVWSGRDQSEQSQTHDVPAIEPVRATPRRRGPASSARLLPVRGEAPR